MRRLTIFVLVMAALYAGYWFFGARTVENAARDAINDLASQGWDFGSTGAETRGFPSRFDTTFSDVELTDPYGQIRYETEFLQAFALSYRPNRVILAFAPEQTITFPGVIVTLASDGFKASAGVSANTDLAFDDFTAEAQSLSVTTDLGIGGAIGRMLLAMRHAGPAENTYDVYLSLPDMMLPAITGAPEPVDVFTFDATLTLDQPLDRHVDAPAIEKLVLNDWAIDWAGSTLRGSGTLVPDAEGFASGMIELQVTEHAILLDQLGRTGAIDPGVAPTWRNMGDAMAAGEPVLILPIEFKNGNISMGLLGFGPAPRFR